MLQATHSIKRERFNPGEIILRQGDPVQHFYMVGSGQAEIWDGQPQAIARLSTNQFFGEVELMGEQTAIATVRAGTLPVEVGLLPKDHFFTIMEESPATVALLENVAQERQRENMARRQPEVRQ
jgi:CRP-like cAMP-binding protein